MTEQKQPGGRSLSVVGFRDFLLKHEDRIAAALPAHLSADRMVSAVMAQINASGDLQKCLKTDQGRLSILQSTIASAVTGLEPGLLGQAYLIPYENKRAQSYICTFVPGWKGIVDVIARTGRAMVRTGVVFKGDEFDYDLGTGMYVKHKPLMKGSRDPQDIEYVYAIGEIAGMQDRIIEVWSGGQVREHFIRFNKVGDKHYAHKHWEMYARKVPLLQVAKHLPKSPEVLNVVAAAYTAERNETVLFDEKGRPLNADFNDDDQTPTKPPIKTPRRRNEPDAQDVEPKPNPLATEAQIDYLKKKAGSLAKLREAIAAAGLSKKGQTVQKILSTLTLDGFNAVKEALK